MAQDQDLTSGSPVTGAQPSQGLVPEPDLVLPLSPDGSPVSVQSPPAPDPTPAATTAPIPAPTPDPTPASMPTPVPPQATNPPVPTPTPEPPEPISPPQPPSPAASQPLPQPIPEPVAQPAAPVEVPVASAPVADNQPPPPAPVVAPIPRSSSRRSHVYSNQTKQVWHGLRPAKGLKFLYVILIIAILGAVVWIWLSVSGNTELRDLPLMDQLLNR